MFLKVFYLDFGALITLQLSLNTGIRALISTNHCCFVNEFHSDHVTFLSAKYGI